MTSEPPEIASEWQPPRSIRGPLWWGVVGAIAAGGLTVATSVAALLEVPGIDAWSDTLAVVAIVPQIAVLVAFVRLGQESADGDRDWDPLARSAGALFGLMWLAAVASLAVEFVGEREWPVFVGGVVAALVLLGLYALALPEAAGAVVVGTFLAARYGLGWWLVGKKLPFDVGVVVAALVLMVLGAIIFPIWFAVVAWGRRATLGPAAGVLAAATLLGVLGFLGVGVWLGYTAATTPNLLAQVEQWDKLFGPQVRVGLAVQLLADGLAALAAALLFRGVAARIPPGDDAAEAAVGPDVLGDEVPPAENPDLQ